MVPWRLTRPFRMNTQKRCPFHYRMMKSRKSRKSRNTWSNRQIWPWSTEWSRVKANSFAHTGDCTGDRRAGVLGSWGHKESDTTEQLNWDWVSIISVSRVLPELLQDCQGTHRNSGLNKKMSESFTLRWRNEIFCPLRWNKINVYIQ